MEPSATIKAAISAAIITYIKTQEEAAAQVRPAAAPPVAAVSLWSSSGRQSQMDMRRLLQMRLFAR